MLLQYNTQLSLQCTPTLPYYTCPHNGIMREGAHAHTYSRPFPFKNELLRDELGRGEIDKLSQNRYYFRQ